MLPRPALGIQGTASHGCPGAASLGGPFCPAGTILQMLWLLPSLMQVPVPAYPPTLGPHSALDYSQVQLAKRYCVGAACYARAERDEDWKVSTDSVTGTSLVNLPRSIFVKWEGICKHSCVIQQFKDQRTMKGRSIPVSVPQPNYYVTLQKAIKCSEPWFSHLK